MLSQTVTREAIAVCKGMEMTHGNSFHYLTFELDSGERVYFQVSIKCYMMIVEGDRCLITYRDSRSSSKKKLKSFEIIAKTVPISTPTQTAEPISAPTRIAEPIFASTPVQEKVTVFETNDEFDELDELDETDEIEPREKPVQKRPSQGNQHRGSQNRGNQNRGKSNQKKRR